MSGVSSRFSLARSFASSARVSACDASVDDVSDAPASRLNDPVVGVRLATAVAPTPLAWIEIDVPLDPSSVVLNGTSANSPPLVPPAMQSDVPPIPPMTWPSVRLVVELLQSLLVTIAVAVAVARAERGLPCTVAVTSTAPAVLPSVSCVDAVPLASVTALVGDNVPLPDVTVNATVTPVTGVSDAFVTSKTTGEASALPTEPTCPLPLTAAMAAGVLVVGLVESLHAAATAVIKTANIVLPREAVIRESIAVSAFSVL